MKKIVFFDVDNTIYNHKASKIMPNTIKLIKELANNKEVSLGLATGRGLGRLDEIKEILPYFDNLVLSNGAYVKFKDKVLVDDSFNEEELVEIKQKAILDNIVLGGSTKNFGFLLNIGSNTLVPMYENICDIESVIKKASQLWGATRNN